MNNTLTGILPYAVQALAILLTVALFVLVKAEIRARLTRMSSKAEELEASLRLVECRLADLDIRASPPKQPARPRPAPVRTAAEPTAMRLEAIALFEQGVQPEDIVSQLGIPRNEVDLMLKFHRAARA
jgi:hypothetical protein